ncbi:MAG: hypothetical protein SPH90_06510 [Candidatus Alectryocaccobium sp.]|nr:hypothetical protein [Candidatus Alectryocaccobium sp.]
MDADMNITKDTKLKDFLMEYPWIKDEIIKINDKFKMLNTPIGKVMLVKADITEMGKKSGMDSEQIIFELTEIIKNHQQSR